MAMIRNIAILGVVALAGAGGAAYFLTTKPPARTPAPSTPAAPAAPAVTPAATPANVPLPGEAGSATAPSSQPTAEPGQFVNAIQQYTLTRDSAAYVGASLQAPQMYPLKAGTGLISASKSPDGAWIAALTANGATAFLPTADLGPYDPHSEPQLNLAATVSGQAKVSDTATISVDGKLLALAGVVAETGQAADDMQAAIDAQGGTLNCKLQTDAYQCLLPNGEDLARDALFNGGADVAADASPDYKAQADAAKAAHRGRWK
jgi:hypothetical protein